MDEDKAAFERECETRRSDLARIQNKRVQEFDLLTTTAGLDLIHIVQATEPSSPVETGSSDVGRRAAGISDSPEKSSDPRKSSRPVTLSAIASSVVRKESPKMSSADQRSSTSKVVPQYVPMVTPKTKASPGQATPETTHL